VQRRGGRSAVHLPVRGDRPALLGADTVVDRERGPLVLEVNARPGLRIQNVTGRGLLHAVDPASIG
jgi:hypothetical protein